MGATVRWVIRMIIAPVIFATVVAGIATMGDMKDLGRIGIRTLVYFEIVTTPLALVIAMVVVNLMQPGAGINADPATLDAKAVAAYASSAEQLTTVQFLLNAMNANTATISRAREAGATDLLRS